MQYSNVFNIGTVIVVLLGCGLVVQGLKDPKDELKYQVNIFDYKMKPEILKRQAEYDLSQYQMTSAEGIKYDCYIPIPLKEEKEFSLVVPTPLEIETELAAMGSSCIMRLEGWWTYEFCFHKHVAQFHQPKEGAAEQYSYLGVYNDKVVGEIKNLRLDRTQNDIDIPYYTETYSDGTKCELTPYLPRTTEVRYYCHQEKSNIIKTMEPSSCNYIVEVYTPHMCSFSVFKPKQSPILDVQCFLAESESDIL